MKKNLLSFFVIAFLLSLLLTWRPVLSELLNTAPPVNQTTTTTSITPTTTPQTSTQINQPVIQPSAQLTTQPITQPTRQAVGPTLTTTATQDPIPTTEPAPTINRTATTNSFTGENSTKATNINPLSTPTPSNNLTTEVSETAWSFAWEPIARNSAGIVEIDGNLPEYRIYFKSNVVDITNIKIDFISPLSSAAYTQRISKIIREGDVYYAVFGPNSWKAGEYSFAPVFADKQYRDKSLKAVLKKAVAVVPSAEPKSDELFTKTEPELTAGKAAPDVTTNANKDAGQKNAETAIPKAAIDNIVAEPATIKPVSTPTPAKARREAMIKAVDVIDGECLTAGIKNRADCDKHLIERSLPADCLKAKLTSQAECRVHILNQKIKQDCLANKNEDCDKILSQTEIENKWQINRTEQSVASSSAASSTKQAIAPGVIKNYLNAECIAAGLTTVPDCAQYLSLNNDCRALGAQSQEECREKIFQSIGRQSCRSALIADDDGECRTYLFNKFIGQTECRGTDSFGCAKSLENHNLEMILIKQRKYDKLAEMQQDSTKVRSVADLKNNLTWASDVVSIKNDATKVTLLNMKKRIILDDSQGLIQTAPAAIAIDTDGDGLPDDAERKIGTDPLKADSDGDTYDDLDELKNGYDPLGDGKLMKNNLAPIHRAIIAGVALEQPETDGILNEQLQIQKVTDVSTTTGSQGYLLNGQATPNSTITLYTYSDMPMIVTVDTDELGNWKYEFASPLEDGEHSIFVAMNDEAGKVVEKSRPFSFFIRDAHAVTRDEYIGTNTKKAPFIFQEPNRENLMLYYVTALFVFVGGGIAIFLFVIKKKKPEALNMQ